MAVWGRVAECRVADFVAVGHKEESGHTAIPQWASAARHAVAGRYRSMVPVVVEPEAATVAWVKVAGEAVVLQPVVAARFVTAVVGVALWKRT